MRIYKGMHIAVLTAVMLGVCVLTLSDTLVDPAAAYVFGLFDTTVDIARLILDRLSPAGGVDPLSRSTVPFATDTIGHFVAWAGVGFVAAGIPAMAINRFNLYLGLFALSAFLEAGQRYLSWSRVAEMSDLVANGLGLAVGFALFSLVENTVLTRFGPLRRELPAL